MNFGVAIAEVVGEPPVLEHRLTRAEPRVEAARSRPTGVGRAGGAVAVHDHDLPRLGVNGFGQGEDAKTAVIVARGRYGNMGQGLSQMSGGAGGSVPVLGDTRTL